MGNSLPEKAMQIISYACKMAKRPEALKNQKYLLNSSLLCTADNSTVVLYNSVLKILFFLINTLKVTKPKTFYRVVHTFVVNFADHKMFCSSFCLLQEISDICLLIITFNISLFYMVGWVWRLLATYLHIPCMAGRIVWPRRALYLCIVLFQGCHKIVICWTYWIFFSVKFNFLGSFVSCLLYILWY